MTPLCLTLTNTVHDDTKYCNNHSANLQKIQGNGDTSLLPVALGMGWWYLSITSILLKYCDDTLQPSQMSTPMIEGKLKIFETPNLRKLILLSHNFVDFMTIVVISRTGTSVFCFSNLHLLAGLFDHVNVFIAINTP